MARITGYSVDEILEMQDSGILPPRVKGNDMKQTNAVKVQDVVDYGPARQEHMEPQHDYIAIKELTGHEGVSRGGIILPEVNDPTGNKRAGGRFVVVAVGKGPWTDRVDSNGNFLRRPMSVRPGDIISIQGKGFLANVGGDQVILVQDYQVCCIYKDNMVQVPS